MRKLVIGSFAVMLSISAAMAGPMEKARDQGRDQKQPGIERISDRIQFVRERLGQIEMRAANAKSDDDRRRFRIMHKSLMDEFRMLRRSTMAAKRDARESKSLEDKALNRKG